MFRFYTVGGCRVARFSFHLFAMHGPRFFRSRALAGTFRAICGWSRRRPVPRLTTGTPFPPVVHQLPKVEIPAVRGTPTPQVKAEARAAATRLRRLEREYWNIVDGSLEEAEVGLPSTIILLYHYCAIYLQAKKVYRVAQPVDMYR